MSKKHDTVLMDKIFREGKMTNYEVADMFSVNVRTIYNLRMKYGYGRQSLLICTVCGQEKKPNTFSRAYSGVCIKCRRKLGVTKPGYGRCGNPDRIKKAMTTCLKCWKPFETRLGYKDEKVFHICEKCTRTNGYLGEEEYSAPVRMYG